MKDLFRSSLLYDFYGQLLTEHQRDIYEEFMLEDLSLSEIADEHGISRQGVHDTVKRCDKLLEKYEDKLQLVKKFEEIKGIVSEICDLTNDTKDTDVKQIRKLAREIIENY